MNRTRIKTALPALLLAASMVLGLIAVRPFQVEAASGEAVTLGSKAYFRAVKSDREGTLSHGKTNAMLVEITSPADVDKAGLTVTYQCSGAESETTVAQDQLEIVKSAGRQFLRWSADYSTLKPGECTIKVKNGSQEAAAEVKLTLLEVTFDPDSENGSLALESENNGGRKDSTNFKSFAVEGEFIFNVAKLTVTPKQKAADKKFLGWKKSDDGENTILSEIPAGTENKVTLKAVYGTPKTYGLELKIDETDLLAQDSAYEFEKVITPLDTGLEAVTLNIKNTGNQQQTVTLNRTGMQYFDLTEETSLDGSSPLEASSGTASVKIAPKAGLPAREEPYEGTLTVVTDQRTMYPLHFKFTVTKPVANISITNIDTDLKKSFGETRTSDNVQWEISTTAPKSMSEKIKPLLEGHLQFTSEGFDAAAKAGSYAVTLVSSDVNGVTAVLTGSPMLTVDKAAPTVSVSASGVSTGAKLSESLLSIDSAVNPNLPETHVEGTVKWDEDAENVTLSETGTHAWTFTPANTDDYSKAKGSAEVTVSDPSLKTPNLAVNAADLSTIYDGTGKSVRFDSDSAGEITVQYSEQGKNSFSATLPVTAGTYDVKAAVAAEGEYAAQTETAVLTIAPRPVSVTFTASGSKPYDGTTDLTDAVTVTGTLGPVAGNENSGPAASDSGRIRLAEGFAAVFDDKNAGESKSITVSGAALDGEAKADYVLEHTGTHTASGASITQAPVTLTLKESAAKTYGTESSLGIADCTVTGAPDGEIPDFELSSEGFAERTSAGTYDITVTDHDPNMDPAKTVLDDRLKINPAGQPVLKEGTMQVSSGVTNGKLGDVSISGVFVHPQNPALEVEGTLSWADPDDILDGSEVKAWKFEYTDTNYEKGPVTGTYEGEITKMEAEKKLIRITAPNQISVYTGSPVSYDTSKVTLEPAEGVTLTVSYQLHQEISPVSWDTWNDQAPSDAGLYDVKLTAQAEGYEKSEFTVALTIEQAESPFPELPKEVEEGTLLDSVTAEGGTLEWHDAGALIQENQNYGCTFHPSDPNYRSVTGEASFTFTKDARVLNLTAYNLPAETGLEDSLILNPKASELKADETVQIFSDAACTQAMSGETAVGNPESARMEIPLSAPFAGTAVYATIVNRSSFAPQEIAVPAETAVSFDETGLVLKPGESVDLPEITVENTDDSPEIHVVSGAPELVSVEGGGTVWKLTAGQTLGTAGITVTVILPHPDPEKVSEKLIFTRVLPVTVSDRVQPQVTASVDPASKVYSPDTSLSDFALTVTTDPAEAAGTAAFDEYTGNFDAGNHELPWTWTPDEASAKHWLPVSGTVSITITAAVPEGEPAFAPAEEAGKTLADVPLDASGFSVPGTVTWDDPLETPLESGKAYGWTFTPEDSVNYGPVHGTAVPYTASEEPGPDPGPGTDPSPEKETPSVTVKADPDTITYGTSLSDVVLSAVESSTPGTAAWADTASLLTAGEQNPGWIFTPEDTEHYNSVSGTLPIHVLKAVPSGAPDFVPVEEAGKTLGDVWLSDDSFNVPGTVSWDDPADTVIEADKEYGWTFTPSDAANWESTSGTAVPWTYREPERPPVEPDDSFTENTVPFIEDPEITVSPSVPETLREEAAAAAAKGALSTADMTALAEQVFAESAVPSEATMRQALERAGIPAEAGTTVTALVKTMLEIDAEAVTPGESILYDVTPVHLVVATTAASASEVVVKGEDAGTPNAVVVAGPEKIRVTRPVTMTLGVPASVLADGESADILHDGIYRYSAAVAAGTVTFTNPDGFSEFLIEKTQTAAEQTVFAHTGGSGTLTLSDLHAAPGQTVKAAAVPAQGWHLKSLTAQDKNGTALEVSLTGSTGTLTMPEAARLPVHVYAVFEQDTQQPPAREQTVVILPSAHGTTEASDLCAAEDEYVTITALPDAGCRMAALVIHDAAHDQISYVSAGTDRYRFRMPDDPALFPVTVQAVYEDPYVTPTVQTVKRDFGTTTVSDFYAGTGAEVTVYTDPDHNCGIKEDGITVKDSAGTKLSFRQLSQDVYVFTMPSSASRFPVTVDVIYEESDSVTVIPSAHGTTSVSDPRAPLGASVTVTAVPDRGCRVQKVIIRDAGHNAVSCTETADGKYVFTMPAARELLPVSVQVVYENPYADPSVRILESTRGVTAVSDLYAHAGDTVYICANPNQGSRTESVRVSDAAGTWLDVTKTGVDQYRFTMPADTALLPVTVSVDYEAARTVTVIVADAEHGAVQVSDTHAAAGEYVTVTTDPDYNYSLKSLSVTDAAGNPVSSTDIGRGQYRFRMPAYVSRLPVTVRAVFERAGSGSGSGSTGTRTVNVIQAAYGTTAVSDLYAKTGQTVTVTAVPQRSCAVAGIVVCDAEGALLTRTADGTNRWQFRMPSWSGRFPVTVQVLYENPAEEETVKISERNGGTTLVSSVYAQPGASVTAYAAPKPGFLLQDITVTDADGAELSLRSLGGGKYGFTVPAAEKLPVTVSADYETDGTATVLTPETDGGITSVSDRWADPGQTVTVYTDPENGYTVSAVTAQDRTGAAVEVTFTGSGRWQLVMPASRAAAPVTVKTVYAAAQDATVLTVASEYGITSVSDRFAKPGDTVTVTASPAQNCFISAVSVTDRTGAAIAAVLKNGSSASGVTEYTFTMPADAGLLPVTVNVTYRLGADHADCPSKAFTDLDTSKWYHGAVDFALREGLMAGISATEFSPGTPVTRAMAVTMIWRMAGSPEPSGSFRIFYDVEPDRWYTRAVQWAASKNIVMGTDPQHFEPYDVLTREQMAALMHRSAAISGLSASGAADLSAFTDASAISGWAREDVAWAVSANIMQGTGSALEPGRSITRAETAQIFMSVLTSTRQ